MNNEKILMVLKSPHTSEKSTLLADRFSKYTFKVLKTANKFEVKNAVETLFNVKVKDVTVLNVKGKQKRFRQMLGKRSDWKKAIVSLEKGHEIDFSVTE